MQVASLVVPTSAPPGPALSVGSDSVHTPGMEPQADTSPPAGTTLSSLVIFFCTSLGCGSPHSSGTGHMWMGGAKRTNSE